MIKLPVKTIVEAIDFKNEKYNYCYQDQLIDFFK